MEKLFAIRNKRFQVKCLLFALYKVKTYFLFYTLPATFRTQNAYKFITHISIVAIKIPITNY